MICALARARRGGQDIPLLRGAVLALGEPRGPEVQVEVRAAPEPGSVSAENVKDFPNVVVQLPMFNEKEVCQAVIDAACQLDWPKSRMMVQVLDDSTAPRRGGGSRTRFSSTGSGA